MAAAPAAVQVSTGSVLGMGAALALGGRVATAGLVLCTTGCVVRIEGSMGSNGLVCCRGIVPGMLSLASGATRSSIVGSTVANVVGRGGGGAASLFVSLLIACCATVCTTGVSVDGGRTGKGRNRMLESDSGGWRNKYGLKHEREDDNILHFRLNGHLCIKH